MTVLILHVGLPKTGTTTLQTWADSNREKLIARNVIYPRSEFIRPIEKHQEIISGLVHDDWDGTERLFSSIHDRLAGHGDTEARVLLSAEGLTAHLPEAEADPSRLLRFREYLSSFDVTLFVMTRELQAWLKSYHQQIVCNPPNARFGYATGLNLEDFARSPRVQALMDLPSLLERCTKAYAPKDTLVCDLQSDWSRILADRLAIPDLADEIKAAPKKNIGLSPAATEVLRQINSQDKNSILTSKSRSDLVEFLRTGTMKQSELLDANVTRLIECVQPESDAEKDILSCLRKVSQET